MLVALLAAQAKAMAERPAEGRQRLVCYSSNQVQSLLLLTAMPAVPADEHTQRARIGSSQPSGSTWRGKHLIRLHALQHVLHGAFSKGSWEDTGFAESCDVSVWQCCG